MAVRLRSHSHRRITLLGTGRDTRIPIRWQVTRASPYFERSDKMFPLRRPRFLGYRTRLARSLGGEADLREVTTGSMS
jgi:hypothetical protein